MTESDYGFFIQSLAIKGPGKADAELLFTDGLNVVAGASDTGKSYALSCIDYAFGASRPPRRIQASAGYDTVIVSIISRNTKDRITIERGLVGGDVKLSRFAPSGSLLQEGVISAKHSPDDPNTISGVLLELSLLWGKLVRTNKQGKRRPLSFRDVAFLCLVEEGRIIEERPPHLSGSFTEKTLEGEVFRQLVTGRESGEVFSSRTKKQAATVAAQLDLIRIIIAESEAKIAGLGVNVTTLESELTALENARSTTLAEYESSRVEISGLESTFVQRDRELREVQSRQQVVIGLTNRFRLLERHYQADIMRLHAIEESGSLLESLPSRPCPVCGAPPNQHTPNEAFNPADVQIGARAEGNKIGKLRDDLGQVLEEMRIEATELQTREQRAMIELNLSQSRIDGELMPRVKESAETLRAQNIRRDLLLQAKSAIEQLNQFREHEAEFVGPGENSSTSSTDVVTAPTTAEVDSFATAVEALLTAWKYPDLGRVVFSEEEQDLVIAGQPRTGHGKGVRALTCAAYIVGLLRHCRSTHLPHPSVVVLDSPLLAYREPDTSDAETQRLLQSGVKEAFYLSLAAGDALGQVIVFENEDAPVNLNHPFTRIHFTKSASGRYGLFPR